MSHVILIIDIYYSSAYFSLCCYNSYLSALGCKLEINGNKCSGLLHGGGGGVGSVPIEHMTCNKKPTYLSDAGSFIFLNITMTWAAISNKKKTNNTIPWKWIINVLNSLVSQNYSSKKRVLRDQSLSVYIFPKIDYLRTLPF